MSGIKIKGQCHTDFSNQCRIITGRKSAAEMMTVGIDSVIVGFSKGS